MSRRDKRGRVLRNGESQRSDGRYCYKYLDGNGKPKFVYSWKLEVTDRLPSGKKDTKALREQEKDIQRDILNGVFCYDDLTVYELCCKYVNQKTGVRHNTKANYKTILKFLSGEAFGKKKIDKVNILMAKEWLIYLQRDLGKSYSTVHNIRGVVRQAFKLAYESDLIRKNPFDFELADVLVNDSVKRQAISKSDEKKFLTFVKSDKCYSRHYGGMYILFNTGLRVSELCGLTISDLDLKKKTLNVNCQLQKKRNGEYITEKTKSKAGTRLLPITDDVCKCFEEILKDRPKLKVEPMVNGKCGFIFLDRFNMPTTALHWSNYFKRALEKYNDTYKVQLPKISPHICRHTYCTNMAKALVNPKTLQYLMGHSDIGVTLNTYTHFEFADVESAVRKIKLG